MRRSNASSESASENLRDDVLEYGAALYETLRRRRDFGTASERVREREVRQKRSMREVETDT